MSTCFCTTGNRWPLTSTNLCKEKGKEFKYKSSQCAFQVARLHITPLQAYISDHVEEISILHSLTLKFSIGKQWKKLTYHIYQIEMYFYRKSYFRWDQFWCCHQYQLLHSTAEGSIEQIIENFWKVNYVFKEEHFSSLHSSWHWSWRYFFLGLSVFFAKFI